MGLLDELQRMQRERAKNRSAAEYEAEVASQARQAQKTATQVQWQQRQAMLAQQQQAALQNQIGQYNPPIYIQQAMQQQQVPSVFEQMIAQQTIQAGQAMQAQSFADVMAAMGMADKHKAAKPEPAKPKSKPVEITEPGQRKIETDE